MTLKKCLLLIAAFAAGHQVCASEPVDTCPLVRIVPERLPDLTLPRSGHCIFYAGNELTLVGGHTTHFMPTPTAEYLSDSQWHQL